MNRASSKPERIDSEQDARDDRMGLAPVFAAAFAAACCLGVPVLVGLLAGSTTAAASSGGSDLLSLVIIGFALGGVLVLALSYLRVPRPRSDESPQGKAAERGESGSSR